MSRTVYVASTGQKIKLEQSPLESGGEGAVYRIASPAALRGSSCVKLYQRKIIGDPARQKEREEKIGFMVGNQPPSLRGNRYQLCWPTDAIHGKNNNFEGFTMPLAPANSISFYNLSRKDPEQASSDWEKFDRSKKEGVLTRLKVCVNLAIAVHEIHSTNRYTLVDLKPQNLLITPEGKFSVIDLDSIQISRDGNVLYPAEAATPGYKPPEAKELSSADSFIPETWDRFSIAVIFYKFLIGAHPFSGVGTGKYDGVNELQEMIYKGLFPFGPKSKYVNPFSTHERFKRLPKRLQNAFGQAFVAGHSDPWKRPSAEQWGKFLNKEIRGISNGKRANIRTDSPGNNNSYTPPTAQSATNNKAVDTGVDTTDDITSFTSSFRHWSVRIIKTITSGALGIFKPPKQIDGWRIALYGGLVGIIFGLASSTLPTVSTISGAPMTRANILIIYALGALIFANVGAVIVGGLLGALFGQKGATVGSLFGLSAGIYGWIDMPAGHFLQTLSAGQYALASIICWCLFFIATSLFSVNLRGRLRTSIGSGVSWAASTWIVFPLVIFILTSSSYSDINTNIYNEKLKKSKYYKWISYAVNDLYDEYEEICKSNPENKESNKDSLLKPPNNTAKTTSYPHLREEDNKYSPIIKTLDNGEVVHVHGCIRKYCKVTFNYKNGWVHIDYLLFPSDPGYSSNDKNEDTNNDNGYDEDILVWRYSGIRKRKYADSKILEWIPSGSKVEYLYKSDGYYKVKYEGEVGYIKEKMIHPKSRK